MRPSAPRQLAECAPFLAKAVVIDKRADAETQSAMRRVQCMTDHLVDGSRPGQLRVDATHAKARRASAGGRTPCRFAAECSGREPQAIRGCAASRRNAVLPHGHAARGKDARSRILSS
jgi:hypothetical protein